MIRGVRFWLHRWTADRDRCGGSAHGWQYGFVQHLGLVSVLVRDYDEAIAFYTNVLGFHLIEDTTLDENKRWVVVAPPGARETGVLLARASTPMQARRIGDQTGGRVFLFLYTDDLPRDYQRLRAAGVRFTEQPRQESYGDVVVFEDLFGNRWDLIRPAPGANTVAMAHQVPT
jgi:catechol 2,3-dioxygenase-like lactoylglutathione lyase family enzyme